MLASLPASELERLLPELREVELSQRDLIFEVDEPTSKVVFPTGAVVSLVTLMDDGQSVEAALMGREGVAGAWLAARVNRAPWRAVVQASGPAFVLDAGAFLALLERQPGLETLVLRLLIAQHYLTSQSVGCNRFHDLGARAARWLLMFSDRLNTAEVHLTQEFLSQMLGVHRPSVTVALRTLEQAALIRRVGRGRIELLDRAGLEAASCECYERVRHYLQEALADATPDVGGRVSAK